MWEGDEKSTRHGHGRASGALAAVGAGDAGAVLVVAVVHRKVDHIHEACTVSNGIEECDRSGLRRTDFDELERELRREKIQLAELS